MRRGGLCTDVLIRIHLTRLPSTIGIMASNTFRNGVGRSGMCHSGGGSSHLSQWVHISGNVQFSILLIFSLSSPTSQQSETITELWPPAMTMSAPDSEMVAEEAPILTVAAAEFVAISESFVLVFVVDVETFAVTAIMGSLEKNREKTKTAVKKGQLRISIYWKI